jgi:hypothetical protein
MFLSGQNTYKVNSPKDIPANMFWSMTAYDNETRSQLTNEAGLVRQELDARRC